LRRRVSLGDITIAGAILGAAAAILLTSGLDISIDDSTGKITLSPSKEEIQGFFGSKGNQGVKAASASQGEA